MPWAAGTGAASGIAVLSPSDAHPAINVIAKMQKIDATLCMVVPVFIPVQPVTRISGEMQRSMPLTAPCSDYGTRTRSGHALLRKPLQTQRICPCSRR
ncbi:hypothetical protein ACFOSU_14255 [Salinisphaera aquimarina]|uniref:Uncharacterized protein n=1 Tax=Salinisphaera aquimarina TaxID=2094031 RepID=A0ABV7ETC6_9GAMM